MPALGAHEFMVSSEDARKLSTMDPRRCNAVAGVHVTDGGRHARGGRGASAASWVLALLLNKESLDNTFGNIARREPLRLRTAPYDFERELSNGVSITF